MIPFGGLGAEIEPSDRGPYPVGTTNMEVAAPYATLSTEEMHSYLNRTHASGRFLSDILKYPESSWVFSVDVPNLPSLYGESSGARMDFSAYVAYPTSPKNQRSAYVFPYADASDGVFEHMQGPENEPLFYNPFVRYPLIVITHGGSAHGLYNVAVSKLFASHGYIAVSLSHGDGVMDRNRNDLYSLRPLAIKELVDSLLESESFGPHIDSRRIGIYGHSFGGMTALSSAGARIFDHPSAVTDRRIKAAVGMEPSMWRMVNGAYQSLFGANNRALSRIEIPYLSINGSEYVVRFDELESVSGTTYGVLLPNQPHVFEGPSWNDAQNWALVFFDAYLKNDDARLELLKIATSVTGFNPDFQQFARQRIVPPDELAFEEAFGADPVFVSRVHEGASAHHACVYFSKGKGTSGLSYDLQYTSDGRQWFSLDAVAIEGDFSSESLPDLDSDAIWSALQDNTPTASYEAPSRLYRIRCDPAP